MPGLRIGPQQLSNFIRYYLPDDQLGRLVDVPNAEDFLAGVPDAELTVALGEYLGQSVDPEEARSAFELAVREAYARPASTDPAAALSRRATPFASPLETARTTVAMVLAALDTPGGLDAIADCQVLLLRAQIYLEEHGTWRDVLAVNTAVAEWQWAQYQLLPADADASTRINWLRDTVVTFDAGNPTRNADAARTTFVNLVTGHDIRKLSSEALLDLIQVHRNNPLVDGILLETAASWLPGYLVRGELTAEFLYEQAATAYAIARNLPAMRRVDRARLRELELHADINQVLKSWNDALRLNFTAADRSRAGNVGPYAEALAERDRVAMAANQQAGLRAMLIDLGVGRDRVTIAPIEYVAEERLQTNVDDGRFVISLPVTFGVRHGRVRIEIQSAEEVASYLPLADAWARGHSNEHTVALLQGLREAATHYEVATHNPLWSGIKRRLAAVYRDRSARTDSTTDGRAITPTERFVLAEQALHEYETLGNQADIGRAYVALAHRLNEVDPASVMVSGYFWRAIAALDQAGQFGEVAEVCIDFARLQTRHDNFALAFRTYSLAKLRGAEAGMSLDPYVAAEMQEAQRKALAAWSLSFGIGFVDCILTGSLTEDQASKVKTALESNSGRHGYFVGNPRETIIEWERQYGTMTPAQVTDLVLMKAGVLDVVNRDGQDANMLVESLRQHDERRRTKLEQKTGQVVRERVEKLSKGAKK